MTDEKAIAKIQAATLRRAAGVGNGIPMKPSEMLAEADDIDPPRDIVEEIAEEVANLRYPKPNWGRDAHEHAQKALAEAIHKYREYIRRTEQQKPSGFVPLDKPKDGHDMAIGPCSCGAWHDESDSPAPPPKLMTVGQAISRAVEEAPEIYGSVDRAIQLAFPRLRAEGGVEALEIIASGLDQHGHFEAAKLVRIEAARRKKELEQ